MTLGSIDGLTHFDSFSFYFSYISNFSHFSYSREAARHVDQSENSCARNS